MTDVHVPENITEIAREVALTYSMNPDLRITVYNAAVTALLRLAASGGWRPSETIAFLDGLADLMDGWAKESRKGGWSTHQVQPNMKAADSCRREAARLKTLFPDPAGERGG